MKEKYYICREYGKTSFIKILMKMNSFYKIHVNTDRLYIDILSNIYISIYDHHYFETDDLLINNIFNHYNSYDVLSNQQKLAFDIIESEIKKKYNESSNN